MKTPVAKRRSKGRMAPNTSPVLSGLTPKRLGSGGLKFGGGANVTDDDDDEGDEEASVLTEVEEEEEEDVSDMALMQRLLLLLGTFLGNERGPQTENWVRLKAPAMAMALWFGWERDRPKTSFSKIAAVLIK